MAPHAGVVVGASQFLAEERADVVCRLHTNAVLGLRSPEDDGSVPAVDGSDGQVDRGGRLKRAWRG